MSKRLILKRAGSNMSGAAALAGAPLQVARVPDQHAAVPYRFMLLLMPRFAASILLMGVGLNLSSCSKRLPGDTNFTEATKTFEKELTRDQRKTAIKQLQSETAGGANRP